MGVARLLPLGLLMACAMAGAQQAPPGEGQAAGQEGPLLPGVVEEGTPTVVGFEDYSDPLEGLNRRIFVFNDVLYRHALVPLGTGYQRHVPAGLRVAIGNFFSNLREPLDAANHALQTEFPDSGRNLVRFGLNTTLGILGIFDVAEAWLDMPDADTSLNETLSLYGVGYGAYLVLPVMGPTDVRRGLSTTVETLVSPLRQLADDPDAGIAQAFGNFHSFSPNAEAYLELRAQSEDPYLYFRNQYLQGIQRDQEAGREDE